MAPQQESIKGLKQRARRLSNPNDLQEPNLLLDPGNHPSSHFRERMKSNFRYQMREKLVKFTTNQSDQLFIWQSKYRSYWNDLFFSYTAMMGSHTFYVIFLPMPVWFGNYEMTKDLVYILGYSIYLSGFFKDYWCLPRPRAPPLHRITLSKYTEKEYGAPSSHTANATGVAFYFIWKLFFMGQNNDRLLLLHWKKFGLILMVLFYYFTLVLGRIYCGMHGLLDLISGAVIGTFCTIVRLSLRNYFLEDFQCASHIWFPLWSIGLGLFLLFNHIEPIDECPCFGDSVAFIGVVSGLEIGDWIMNRFNLNLVYSIHYQGLFNSIMRTVVGVSCVIIWKYALSKPLVYQFLIKILRFKDDRKEKALLHEKSAKENANECPLFIGFPKIDIIGRFIIYAGIPMVVVLVTPKAISYFNL
ncbi:sphinganine kinase LCB3 NDAI_0G06220 [Naumovozyma dairenensis CBS 421]|uniref:Phosphatidic acid phosphatase type 2/haloperoxidase domain-containing protein n=1 Tax=Naumovozyma dairenensis (strain ATCC 10597 / BCRC 20456 / CBS 421 / NBRC 0211 / NRRL Y-12639) TaxID=1071378 RepID=J7SBV4_NAUDC|nr:hypothetical protein NDAI_0G06220 [Naumovozyma dairenensis CBS 421]CCK73605.1 hypothetical protein NDAI_0G06220 [Naumovozyma dairenensis CBS 421]